MQHGVCSSSVGITRTMSQILSMSKDVDNFCFFGAAFFFGTAAHFRAAASQDGATDSSLTRQGKERDNKGEE